MSPERHKKIPIIKIRNIPVPKEQMGLSVIHDKTKDLDFVPAHAKGSTEIRPPEKKKKKKKRPSLLQMEPKRQIKVLLKKGFELRDARRMVATKDLAAYYGPPPVRVLEQTSEGGLVVSDQKRRGQVDSLIGSTEGVHKRLRSPSPDTIGTAKID